MERPSKFLHKMFGSYFRVVESTVHFRVLCNSFDKILWKWERDVTHSLSTHENSRTVVDGNAWEVAPLVTVTAHMQMTLIWSLLSTFCRYALSVRFGIQLSTTETNCTSEQYEYVCPVPSTKSLLVAHHVCIRSNPNFDL